MIKSILRSPAFSVVLFVLAAALLLGGTIGAVQAAPRIQSADWRGQVVLTNIETALTENGIIREGDDQLLTTFLKDNGDDELKIGKTYPYKLGVRNVADGDNGGIPQYVRVIVKKYWVYVDENGNPLPETTGKKCSIDPSLINLHFVEGNGWTIDKDASTPEQTVLYYDRTLATGEDSSNFTDTLTIDSKVLNEVTKHDDGVTYDYDGVEFRIKASVDAVQDHNPEPAMTSAWGRTNEA